MSWCSLATDSASRCILILWDTRILEIVDSCMGSFAVLEVLKNVEDGVQ